MRKIIFRGKRKDNGEWVYGWYVNKAEAKHQIVTKEDVMPISVHPETVGQFIGLTDKNGKEIYEGDALLNSIGRHYIVEFYKGSFWIKCNETLYSCLLVAECSHLKIIGNIHDNPELLK